MKCLLCKTPTMQSVAVDPALTVEQCTTCGGQWIPSRRYWAFLQESGLAGAAEIVAAPGAVPAPLDSTGAKLCPECAHFLHRYDVGHGVTFAVDRCNACGGFWLDAHEWPALAARNLHTQMHLITSDAWQREIDRQKRDEARRRLMLEKLGPADFAEVHRIKQWLDSHPKKAELYAFLLGES